MSDDLQALRDRHYVYELLDRLDIRGRVRDEFTGEPTAALVILQAAAEAQGINNRAAYAISRWRARREALAHPPPPIASASSALDAAERDRPPGPPDLDAIEQAWSAPRSEVGELLLRVMATAIARHGGYAALKESFARRRITEG